MFCDKRNYWKKKKKKKKKELFFLIQLFVWKFSRDEPVLKTRHNTSKVLRNILL